MRRNHTLVLISTALMAIAACNPSVAEDPTREQLLAERAVGRAYDGAPPVIPHQVVALGRTNCNGCHTPGASSNSARIAPPRSHTDWGQCRQCHVEQLVSETFVASHLEPLRNEPEGSQQTAIAPPMIPHSTQGREQCAICHMGEQAPAALRAPHEMRPNCQQCHLEAPR